MSSTESHPPDSGATQTPAAPRDRGRRRFAWLRYAFAWPVPLQPLLWGVDDAETRRSIEQVVYQKRSGMRWLVVFAIGVGILGIVANQLVARVSPAFPQWAVTAGVVILCQSCIAWWLRRGILRDLRRVLASLGRCEGCGYDLKECSDGACPECGVQVERREETGKPAETG